MATADDGQFSGSYVGTASNVGGSIGSAYGPVGGLIGKAGGAIVGLGLGGVKYLLGSAQRKAANAMHLIDPGYQLNNEVIDNARVTGDQYANYQLPGYQNILNNIRESGVNAQENAERGATSSADVLDAANKGNQVQQNELNSLGIQTAAGKQSALTAYLAAKAAAGEEYQNKNTYDREQYERQLQLKNQLKNNATANQYAAADQTGKLIASIFSYKGGVKQPGPTGPVSQGAPIFNTDGATNTSVDKVITGGVPDIDTSASIGNPNNYNS